jgi:hypothetical protein
MTLDMLINQKGYSTQSRTEAITHHAREKIWFFIFDIQEHVDSENIKLKIGYGSSLYQLFFKT